MNILNNSEITLDLVKSKMFEINKIYSRSSNQKLYYDKEYFIAINLCYFVSTAKTKNYITEDGIDFPLMLEENYFSSGEKLLINLAWNLFNGGTVVTPYDLIGTLGNEYFDMAINAIELRQKVSYIMVENFEVETYV